MIIAIDGPAASGKSSIARMVAQHYGLPHLDTGSLYRAVARDVLKAGAKLDDCAAAEQAAKSLDPAELADPELRKRGCGEAASVVAAIPEVRSALLAFQRAFAGQPGGAVVEGRDIGTVVCPDADAKIFLTATLEGRAQRRYLELRGYGLDITKDKVRDEIAERDRRDTTRPVSPLRKADDAHLLDTTDLDIEKAFLAAVKLIDAAAAGR
jgi:cytidylate kinase